MLEGLLQEGGEAPLHYVPVLEEYHLHNVGTLEMLSNKLFRNKESLLGVSNPVEVFANYLYLAASRGVLTVQ